MIVHRDAFTCEHCHKPLIELRGGPDNATLLVNWHASPAGNIIIKGNKAVVLRDAYRAKRFLKLAGVPEADRFIVHSCWGKTAPKPKKRKR